MTNMTARRARSVARDSELGASAGFSRAGWVVICLQLCAMLIYSVVEYHRFALSGDFSIYYQSWYLIGRGDLNPYNTTLGFPFWRNNGEFLMWPLALIGLVFKNGIVLLWLQDFVMVAAEAVGFLWILDVLRRPSWPSRLSPDAVVALAIVLLVANPWTYWAGAFDFHFEPFAALFILLAAWALERHQLRRCALWVTLALLCGELSASLIAGLGFAAIIAGKQWRRPGVFLVVTGVAWVVILSHLGMQGGNLSADYGYLASSRGTTGPISTGQLVIGVVMHPLRVLDALWVRRFNILANLAPSGLIGIVSPWALGVPLVMVLSSNLVLGYGFSLDPAQNLPMYVFVTVGTVFVLGRLAVRYRWGGPVALVLAAVLAANTVGWAIVWMPRVPIQWLRISPAAAGVLSRIEGQIPSSAEVVASQGVSGRFSGRRNIYPIFGPGQVIPAFGHHIYFVLTAFQGVEESSSKSQLALIARVAAEPGARLIGSGQGIWGFCWNPPKGTRSLVLQARGAQVHAWSVTGPAAVPVVSGVPSQWYASANGRAGYMIERAYWRYAPGSYVASVSLSSSVPVKVEVWNATGQVLLARRNVPPTNGLQTTRILVNASRVYSPNVYTGAGVFRITYVPPRAGNRLEIRVWSPGGGAATVSALALRPVAAG